MSKYFVVKASGANVSVPVLDSVIAKPYLVIKNKGYVPLTTETGTSGVKVKGKNGRIYRVAKTTTVQRSSTFISDCTTTYTSPENMQETVSNVDITATYMAYDTYTRSPNSTYTYFTTSKSTFTYAVNLDMWLYLLISKQPGASYTSSSTTNTRGSTRQVTIQDYSISVLNSRSPSDNNAGYVYVVAPRQTTSYNATAGSSTNISALFKTTKISYSITSSSQIAPYARLITNSVSASTYVTLTTLDGGNNGNNSTTKLTVSSTNGLSTYNVPGNAFDNEAEIVSQSKSNITMGFPYRFTATQKAQFSTASNTYGDGNYTYTIGYADNTTVAEIVKTVSTTTGYFAEGVVTAQSNFSYLIQSASSWKTVTKSENVRVWVYDRGENSSAVRYRKKTKGRMCIVSTSVDPNYECTSYWTDTVTTD